MRTRTGTRTRNFEILWTRTRTRTRSVRTRYFKILCTRTRYFKILCTQTRYFKILWTRTRYFKILWTRTRYFKILWTRTRDQRTRGLLKTAEFTTLIFATYFHRQGILVISQVLSYENQFCSCALSKRLVVAQFAFALLVWKIWVA